MTKQSTTHSRRIAFVDLLFCWPPNGGADVDLYHVLEGLARREMNIKLFVPQFEGITGRGIINSDDLPFPVEVLFLPRDKQTEHHLIAAIQSSLAQWLPDAVFLTHGYALKPAIALALADHLLISRYYAHELLCARDAFRFKDLAPCPYNYLEHPDHCRLCAARSLSAEIRSGVHQAWVQEYLLAKAYSASYHRKVRQSLDTFRRIIVYNAQLREELGTYKDKAVVIPGGVSEQMPGNATAHAGRFPEDKKVILASGRMEDPAKGLQVLLEAGERLARERDDFHIVATHFDPMFRGPFFSSTGWLSYGESRELYARAAICVVPSIWREPFGLVAVEAMVAELPVCASDTGGLHDIVVPEETGLLFPPGDATALAQHLDRLLDNPELRQRMGSAGRDRVLTHYSWDSIIDKHYIPLLESLP